MEGNRIIEESYNQLQQLLKSNMTDTITIDYKNLDDKTRSELKDLIHGYVSRRQGQLFQLISGAK